MIDWEVALEERNRVRVDELRERNVELMWRTKQLIHRDGHTSCQVFLEARIYWGGQVLGSVGPLSYHEQDRTHLINRMVSGVTGQAMLSLSRSA